jgi:2-phosphoglycerate kinase
MFYLIGGAPRCGKTTTAKMLSERLSIPWISTDTLESIVTEYVAPADADALFPKNILRRTTNQSNDEMYTKYTSNEIVTAFITNGKSLEKAITTFLDCEQSYTHDYILEGHHIHPQLVTELKVRFPIKSVFLGRLDEAKTEEAITLHALPYDWVTKKTSRESTFALIAATLCAFSRNLEEQCTQYSVPFVTVDTDFPATLKKIVANF